MFCIIRSHSLSIWPISLWSDVVKSVGSRSKEQKWCPPTDSGWPESLCIPHFLLDTGAVFLLPFPSSPLCGSSMDTGAVLISPSHGRVAVRTSSLELQLPIAHSLISLMTAFLQLDITWRKWGALWITQIVLISNLAKYVRPSNLNPLPATSSTEGQCKKIPQQILLCCPPQCPFFSFYSLWI